MYRRRVVKSQPEALMIKRILKSLNAGRSMSITAQAVSDLVSMTRHVFIELVMLCGTLLERSKKSTLSSRDVQTAVRLFFCGELAKHAVVSGVTAVTNKGQNKSFIRRSYVENKLRDCFMFPRISRDATIYMASVLEYLLEEILELSSNVAYGEFKKTTITPNFIKIAIQHDYELFQIFGDVVIAGAGGVSNNINLYQKTNPAPKRSTASLDQAFDNLTINTQDY